MNPFAGPGGDADLRGQARLAQRLHPVPDRLARVADPVRVVEEEKVERGGPEPPEAPLGRHPQVLGVGVGPAQRRVGEAREAARPVALALVEVVADRADQRVVLARDPGQRPAEHLVGLALAVGVGGEDGVDPVARAQQRSRGAPRRSSRRSGETCPRSRSRSRSGPARSWLRTVAIGPIRTLVEELWSIGRVAATMIEDHGGPIGTVPRFSCTSGDSARRGRAVDPDPLAPTARAAEGLPDPTFGSGGFTILDEPESPQESPRPTSWSFPTGRSSRAATERQLRRLPARPLQRRRHPRPRASAPNGIRVVPDTNTAGAPRGINEIALLRRRQGRRRRPRARPRAGTVRRLRGRPLSAERRLDPEFGDDGLTSPGPDGRGRKPRTMDGRRTGRSSSPAYRIEACHCATNRRCSASRPEANPTPTFARRPPVGVRPFRSPRQLDRAQAYAVEGRSPMARSSSVANADGRGAAWPSSTPKGIPSSGSATPGSRSRTSAATPTRRARSTTSRSCRRADPRHRRRPHPQRRTPSRS